MPSYSEIVDLISRTNKISIIFFVITCFLLAYELYVYQRDKKKKKNPNIPTFNTQTSTPQQLHHAEAAHSPSSTSVPTSLQQPTPTTNAMPPVIAQMKPPGMTSMGLHKKKKNKGVPIVIGATAVLAILTVAIAYKLNQPSSQEAGLTSTGAKAAEPTTAVTIPSQASDLTATKASSPTPTTTSTNKILSLNKTSPVPTTTSRAITATPAVGASTTSSSISPTPTGVLIASGQTIPTVEPTIIATSLSSSSSATVAPTSTIAPTLPVTGTIQYSIGVFALASIVMLASLLF